MIAFLRLSRPLFLFGGGLLLWLGVSDADRVDRVMWAIAQVMVSSVQLTAHYLNEYADVEADRLVRNRTRFSGGSGVLVSGALQPRVALVAGVVSSVSAVVAIGAVGMSASGSAAIGLAALMVSWTYSMPPIRLLGTGWGELITSLTVAGMVPLVGVLSQGATPSPSLWWAVGSLVPAHLAMMLVFELPDLATDRRAGKRVLAVRLGRAVTERCIAGFYLVALGTAAAGTSLSLLWLPGSLASVTAWMAVRSQRWSVATTGAVAALISLTVGFGAG